MTKEELQSLCLSKVRENRANGAIIKGIILEYGGALVADIDPAKWSELKERIEALK